VGLAGRSGDDELSGDLRCRRARVQGGWLLDAGTTLHVVAAAGVVLPAVAAGVTLRAVARDSPPASGLRRRASQTALPAGQGSARATRSEQHQLTGRMCRPRAGGFRGSGASRAARTRSIPG
jgi:hypothetical protein